MARRKPWRNFKENKQNRKLVRWICLAVLGAEAAVLGRQGRLLVPVVEITEDREVVIYQIPLEDGKETGEEGLEIPSKDRVYGIRIRLRDGMVDFYRREELHRQGQKQDPHK